MGAISGGSSLLGGLMGGKGAQKAAQQQINQQNKILALGQQVAGAGQAGIADATQSGQAGVGNATALGQLGVSGATGTGNATLDAALQKILSGYQPYSDAGTGALSQLSDLTGANSPLNKQFSFNPSDLQNDPGYKFTLDQGQKAIQRSAAAQGNLFSTGTMKSLAGYTEGSANQYFGDAYNRALSTFGTNRQSALSQIGALQGIAGLGFGAQQGMAGAQQGIAGQESANTIGSGLFNAQLGQQGAQYGAGLGLQGANLGAQLGMQGVQVGAGALNNIGNAGAAGTAGQYQSWLGALNGGSNSLINGLFMQRMLNGGFGGGGGTSYGGGQGSGWNMYGGGG